MKLLIDGKEAFPEILKCIEESKRNIYINMFIWRDDVIGNKIASSLLSAANRGVKIQIIKDRYGVVLEKAEEVRKSFFHKTQSFSEKIKIFCLNKMYPMKNTPSVHTKDISSILYEKIILHPNIKILSSFRADHSKYYIFDEEVLICGGINIEDKENGQDMQGRVYNDYMVKIIEKDYMSLFKEKMSSPTKKGPFKINSKQSQPYYFEMEQSYLEMIQEAKKYLYITMAYFSPLPHFISALCEAVNRGVEVSICIPMNANYQDASNKKTLRKLMKRTNNQIKVYFSHKMIHTKAIINDFNLNFGSTNITKKAFHQLNELNVQLDSSHLIYQDLLNSLKENYIGCEEIKNFKEIKYNGITAWLEGFLV